MQPNVPSLRRHFYYKLLIVSCLLNCLEEGRVLAILSVCAVVPFSTASLAPLMSLSRCLRLGLLLLVVDSGFLLLLLTVGATPHSSASRCQFPRHRYLEQACVLF